VVDKPSRKPKAGETRTAVAAHELYEHAVSSGLDVRLLSEIFRRWSVILKTDPTLESYFSSEFDPATVGSGKPGKLTDAQKEACAAEKARLFKEELVPNYFNDIMEARGPQELDVFLDTYLYMSSNGKSQYFKQFEEEFARLTSEGFGEVPVTVTTAFELSEEQKALVLAQLEKKAVEGGTPVPTYKVNPSIIGGVQIKWREHEFTSTVQGWFEEGLDNLKKGINQSH